MKSKVFAFLIMLFLTPLVLSGCNTIKGAGQDIKAAGDAIEDKAEDKKTY